MATTISTQDIIDAKRDIDDIGEAVNEVKIVSPRYGDDFKSLPMIAAEAQDTISEWESAISLITQESGVPALAVSDASGKTQQEINNALTDGYAYVEWFGDTTVDATNAINACLEHCATYNKTAKSIPGKTYPCSSTVRIATSCDFTGSKFEYPGGFSSVAVDVRKLVGGVPALFENVKIKLPHVTNNKVPGTIPIAGSIGVRLTGIRDSEIVFNSVQGFEENLQLYSNDVNVYISYNDLRFHGLFVGSKINIHMLCEGSGWINECGWYGGHFAQYSTDRNAYSAINLKLSKPLSSGSNGPNGHTFMRCAMEGDFYRTIDYDFSPELNTSYYSNNTFLNCRFEAAVSMRFSRFALYDTFIGCYGLGDVTFVDDVRPNAIGSPRLTNFKLDGAALVGNAGFRTAKNTHTFQAENSSGAIVISAAFQNIINGGLLGTGAYVLFNPSDATKLQPVLKASFDGGRPSLRMGDGATAPTDSLYWNGGNEWRHTFNLRPATDNASALGGPSNSYTNIYSYIGTFKSGIGLFGATPPATKRSITGKKTPATITEQNAVLDSIVSALVAYGFVSDDRTV